MIYLSGPLNRKFPVIGFGYDNRDAYGLGEPDPYLADFRPGLDM